MDTYVPSIPPALSERLIWRDGSFHASEELKGDTLLDALFARCSRRNGRRRGAVPLVLASRL